MSNIHLNRSQQQAADDKLQVGLTKHASTLASFTIAGTTVKPADVITVLQSRQNTAKTSEAARAAWQAAVAADRNELEKSKALVSGVKQTLKVMFADSADTLADFGLTPRKPLVVSPAVKVAAAAKAKATRAARHTQGPKQKAAIKGTLDGVNLVVSAQPAAPTASPAVSATPTPTAPAAGTGPAAPVPSTK
jgi:hypothetical protein